MPNTAALLEHTAREEPDRDAVVSGSRRWSYSEIDQAANKVANALAGLGIQQGQTVALSCPNLVQFPVIYFGILKTGAAVVPLNILLTEREIAYHLADSGATAYFCFEGSDDLPIGSNAARAFASTDTCKHLIVITAQDDSPTPIEEAVTFNDFIDGQLTNFDTARTREDDTAVVLYTSGTTGRPKGAELTHNNMVNNALLISRLAEPHPHDTHLVTLPLFHSFGLTVHLNAGFGCGATLALLPRFTAEAALEVMARERVTFFAGVPTMYWALISADAPDGVDLSLIAANLRTSFSGGSALPIEVLRAFESRFGVPILEGYGLSETSPIATFNSYDRPRRPGSVGLPVWGIEIKVVRADGTEVEVDEPGEVLIRGHNVMKGYLNRPDATAEAIDEHGWFRTGDIGTRDTEGYLYIVDRKKDLIIRAGFNVYPRELDEVLLTHPAVSLAAVVGIPHEVHGEEVKAFVIPHKGAELDEPSLIAWCKENMAAYKYPRLIEFRDALPMTATGKILKRELAKESANA